MAMAVSTSKRRRKTDGREYDTPPPIPCTPKELNVLLDKWIVDKVFKPHQVLESPQKRSGGTYASAVCTTTCSILPQNGGHSTDWCTVGSKRGL